MQRQVIWEIWDQLIEVGRGWLFSGSIFCVGLDSCGTVVFCAYLLVSHSQPPLKMARTQCKVDPTYSTSFPSPLKFELPLVPGVQNGPLGP
jgi:hypothetical protein